MFVKISSGSKSKSLYLIFKFVTEGQLLSGRGQMNEVKLSLVRHEGILTNTAVPRKSSPILRTAAATTKSWRTSLLTAAAAAKEDREKGTQS